jgi:sec-independent protein translocase protein TatA
MMIASLFNLAGPDMLVILSVLLLFFGAKKLPELARGLGRAVKEFNAARDEIEKELTQAAPAQPTPMPPPTVPLNPVQPTEPKVADVKK